MPKTTKKTEKKAKDKDKEEKKSVAEKQIKVKTKKNIVKKKTTEIKPEKKEKETEKLENIAEDATEDAANKKLAYYYAVGRRKRAIAEVRLYKKGEGEIKINTKEIKEYFPREEWQSIILAPLKAMGQTTKLNVQAKIKGGGVKSQAEAIQLGVARALLKLNPIFKRGLKKHGYLTRDPRVKERKKYGLRGARRAPQWSKR